MNHWLQIVYPLLVGFWFIAHFITNRVSLRHRSYHSTKTFLDDAIPFIPDMAIFYFSGFFLANMAYFLLGSTECFLRIAIGYGMQFVVSISLYTLYPCRINRCESFIPNSPPGYLLAAFQRISKPFNSFPSMHTSFCLFSALSIWGCGLQSTGFFMIIWAVLVSLSALLTKQHHVLDVLAGATLGIGLYLLIF